MAAASRPRGAPEAHESAPRYRRRRPWPALVFLVVLGVAAVYVWTKVFNAASDPEAGIRCPAPGEVVATTTAPTTDASGGPLTPQPKIGSSLTRDALDRTDPVPATDVKVRVFNASKTKGQAQAATDELKQLLFQTATPTNDQLYPAQDLNCHGQIRFGPNGKNAARTLSLVVPCAQLISDERQDDTVDLAVGKTFGEIKPTPDAYRALNQLKEWGQTQPPQQGGQQAQRAMPQLDKAQLKSARDVTC